jgi:hypothetical protein
VFFLPFSGVCGKFIAHFHFKQKIKNLLCDVWRYPDYSFMFTRAERGIGKIIFVSVNTNKGIYQMVIKYWKGMVVPEHILELCAQEIKQIESGDLKSLRFEKLRVSGEILYSIRINEADRLIMTEHAGVLIVLEYIDGHDYDGCQFLRGRGVLKYLESTRGLTAVQIDKKFEAIARDELVALEARARPDSRKDKYIELHSGRWIELSDVQTQASCAQLPLLVSGLGGAGKSTIALSMLLKAALELQAEALACVYITKEQRLVDDMRTCWRGMALQQEGLQDGVRFLTITDVVVEALGIAVEKLVAEEDFFAWWSGKQKRASLGMSKEALWEEICISASCSTESEYLELGQRQSQVAGALRTTIYRVYLDYAATLDERGLVSVALLKVNEIPPKYSLVLLDEAQNMPPALISVFARLAENNNAVYFSGEQQAICSQINNTVRLIKAFYYQQGIVLSEHRLTQTHRCPPQVSTLVTELMKLKRRVIGGSMEKGEQPGMESAANVPLGRVSWLEPNDIASHLDFLQANRTDFVVVTLADYVEEVRRLLPDAVVFTVSEIQGLGVKNLLVYKVFAPLSEVLVAALDSPDHTHRAMRDGMDLTYTQHFNRLITAITRAEGNLTIVEAAGTRYEKIIRAHFAPFCGDIKKDKAAFNKSTEEEWERKAFEYMRLGYIDQAVHIWCKRLLRKKDTLLSAANGEARAVVVMEKAVAVNSHYTAEQETFVKTWAEGLSTAKSRRKHVGLLLAHPNLSLVLMDIPVLDADCVLAYILNKGSGLYLLQAGIEKNIMSYVQQSSGRRAIDYYIDFEPSLLLQEPHKIDLTLIHVGSVSTWLSKGKIEFLQTLLIRSPKHMKKFCADVLFDKQGMKELGGQSVLGWLSSDTKNVKFLKSLLDKNPGLKDRMPQMVLDRNQEDGQAKNNVAEDWLSQPSPEVKQLLQYPDHQLSSILMDIPVRGRTCLLEHILFDKTLKQHVEKMKSSELEKIMRCPQLSSGKYGIDYFVEYFEEFLLKKPECVPLESMTVERVIHWLENGHISLVDSLSHCSIQHTNQFCSTVLFGAVKGKPGHSVLFVIAALGEAGHRFLIKLSRSQPKLFTGTKLRESLYVVDPAAGCANNTSPFFWLTTVQEGISFLSQCFNSNLKTIQALNADILCRAASMGEKNSKINYEEVSPLYFLAGSEMGQELLQEMFIKNEKLIAHIPAKALFGLLNASAGADENTSALYFLALNAYGLGLLQKMFSKNSKLMDGITAEALCSLRTEAAGAMANTSTLFFLATSEVGRALLLDIFNKKPTLIEGITAEALCLPRTAAAGPWANISPLFLLAQERNGQQLLSSMFDGNPKLIEGITAEALCLPRTEAAGPEGNISPLFLLAQGREGQRLLSRMFDENEELIKGITAKALCLSLPGAAGRAANTSALGFLVGGDTGITLLSRMFDGNLELIEGITAEALCLPRTEAAGVEANTTPLFFLARRDAGITLLRRMLDKNPNLIAGITADALKLLVCADVSLPDNKVMSVLYWLSCAKDGHEILKMLLHGNAALCGSIEETFARAMIVSPSTQVESCIFDNLATTPTGRFVSLKLLQHSRPSVFFASPALELKEGAAEEEKVRPGGV